MSGCFAVVVVALLAPPFLLSFATPMYLVARHDLAALPLFLLLTARGVIAGGRVYRSAVAFSLAGLAAAALVAYFSRSPVQGVREQANVVIANAAASDPILATGFTRNSLEYYVQLGGGRQPFFSFPSSFGRHRGWVDERELSQESHVAVDADTVTTMIEARLAADGRVWVAHSRELASANAVLMTRIARTLRQTRCPGDGESSGFTCWQRPPAAAVVPGP